jgi:tetratricopeptide (TPR) repeat protein
MVRSTAPGVAQGAGAAWPSWLPAYTPGQLRLLKPVDVPVQVPAARVYPDLERFGYANSRRLEDVRESLKFTKLVASVLKESPRFYALDEASPDLANTIAQYGPPAAAEADAWTVAQRDAGGTTKLVRAEFSDASRADFDRAEALRKKGDLPGAAAAYQAGAAKSPRAPAFKLGLGDALAASGDRKAARAAYEAALAVDPTFATAHAGLAELLAQTNDSAGAHRELAEALAYHPSSRRALQAADVMTSGAVSAGTGRFRPFPIFIDVDSVGAIHVASASSTPAQLYASCRAVMRYEPDVRAAIFEQPRGTPYYLTAVEEIVCLQAAMGAYLFQMNDDETPGAKADPAMDGLMRLANEEGLSGYVMFEILGRHRPERARMAPPDVHRAIVEYILRHVLGGGGDAPSGVYTARLDPR